MEQLYVLGGRVVGDEDGALSRHALEDALDVAHGDLSEIILIFIAINFKHPYIIYIELL